MDTKTTTEKTGETPEAGTAEAPAPAEETAAVALGKQDSASTAASAAHSSASEAPVRASSRLSRSEPT
ncbi:hypothetical protein ACWCPG_30315, partial [Streptomyces sp. NPDC001919]